MEKTVRCPDQHTEKEQGDDAPLLSARLTIGSASGSTGASVDACRLRRLRRRRRFCTPSLFLSGDKETYLIRLLSYPSFALGVLDLCVLLLIRQLIKFWSLPFCFLWVRSRYLLREHLFESKADAGASKTYPWKVGTTCKETAKQLLILEFMADENNIIHSGGCHCKRVRWQVEAPSSLVAWRCNCSNCSMRANTHFIVPSSKFKLAASSGQFLTTYTFGTHTAKHTFCKQCGITSFYFPRSNPDGVAMTVSCVDPGTVKHVETRYYDGNNWESSYEQSSISSFSKADYN